MKLRKATLDQKIAEGRLAKTVPIIVSFDETFDVGEDWGTPVTENYKERDNMFTGTIHKVTVVVKSCVEEPNGASLPA